MLKNKSNGDPYSIVLHDIEDYHKFAIEYDDEAIWASGARLTNTMRRTLDTLINNLKRNGEVFLDIHPFSNRAQISYGDEPEYETIFDIREFINNKNMDVNCWLAFMEEL